MVIQQTSILAYNDIKTSNINQRQYEVLKVLNKSFFGLSNRIIADRLNKPINQITPRTNELVKMGLVKEYYKVKDIKTKKLVIFWGVTDE